MSTNIPANERELKRANFRLIEKEVYHYVARCKQVAQWRTNIIYATNIPDVAVQSDPGDTTANKAIKLQSGVMAEIIRRLEAIEWACNVYKQHPESARWELVKLKYFEGRLTNDGIMQELSIGHDTFYRWRNEFIQLIADRLGWEV
jgi:hypothetical protein